MNERMTLRELIECSELSGDVTLRMVRFLISNGIVREPYGKNKHAYYTLEHVKDINNYFLQKANGYTVKQIAGMKSEYPMIFDLGRGVQITLSEEIKQGDIDYLVEEFKILLNNGE